MGTRLVTPTQFPCDHVRMSTRSIGLSDELHAYLLKVGVREPMILRRLREETAALPESRMQISPEQGAFMSLLVGLISARSYLEVGTFTGYSSLAVAMAMPADGSLTCCDISHEWTDVAQRYWNEAGVADRVDLRLGPAIDTLNALLVEGAGGSYDFAFLDADKPSYPAYYERILELLRPGGLLAIDNVLWSGKVADPAVDDADTQALRDLNEQIAADPRVQVAMVPIGDGLTLARKLAA
jgi:predicted O-methyltransferase YrrM